MRSCWLSRSFLVPGWFLLTLGALMLFTGVLAVEVVRVTYAVGMTSARSVSDGTDDMLVRDHSPDRPPASVCEHEDGYVIRYANIRAVR